MIGHACRISDKMLEQPEEHVVTDNDIRSACRFQVLVCINVIGVIGAELFIRRMYCENIFGFGKRQESVKQHCECNNKSRKWTCEAYIKILGPGMYAALDADQGAQCSKK